MTDIDVVKKGSRAWLWVVIALGALLLLWFFLANNRGTAVQQTGHRIVEGGQPQLAAVLVQRPIA
jgi:hypothetical protein